MGVKVSDLHLSLFVICGVMFTKEISQIVIVLTKVQYSSEVDNFKEGVI